MRKFFNIFLAGCSLLLLAGPTAAEDSSRPLNPSDAPSEFHKDSDVIDVGILRKRIKENPKTISTWVDSTYGFRFDYPESIKPVRRFEPGPLDDGSWSWFSGKEKGIPLVSIPVKNNTNKTITSEIRFGVSDDADAVAQCRALPEKAKKDSLKTFRNKGNIFTYFTGSEKKEDKFISVAAYRTVRQDKCFSIELLVYGDTPKSAEQKPSSAMKPEIAMKRMDRLWRGMNFQWTAASPAADKK